MSWTETHHRAGQTVKPKSRIEIHFVYLVVHIYNFSISFSLREFVEYRQPKAINISVLFSYVVPRTHILHPSYVTKSYYKQTLLA